jgi:hypothetical protein
MAVLLAECLEHLLKVLFLAEAAVGFERINVVLIVGPVAEVGEDDGSMLSVTLVAEMLASSRSARF